LKALSVRFLPRIVDGPSARRPVHRGVIRAKVGTPAGWSVGFSLALETRLDSLCWPLASAGRRAYWLLCIDLFCAPLAPWRALKARAARARVGRSEEDNREVGVADVGRCEAPSVLVTNV
jgi:hypothetical protein